MYERVLVPTDGSEYAEEAADTGFELAGALNASVFIISVIEPGPLGDVRLPGDAGSAREVFEDRANTFVERVADRARERDLPVSTVVRQGVPVTEILAYADEIDADLIVIGTRGRGGVSRMMLGSVADRVIRYGDVDVLVVEPDSGRIAGGSEKRRGE